MIDQLYAWVVSLIFAAAMLSSWFIGLQWGKRWPPHPGDETGGKFTDASMALLGLLLAFTFSMSLGRHDDRRQAAVAHSNALGDFYTCASLLKEPHRSQLQDLLREYARYKLDIGQGHLFMGKDNGETIQRTLDMYNRATSIVTRALTEGTPVAVPLVNTLNNLTSSNALRRAANRERLPWIIAVLLLLGSMIPAFLMGQRQGGTPGANLSGTFSFFILVTLVIYVIFDLNQPTRGLITVSQESLERVIQSMGK